MFPWQTQLFVARPRPIRRREFHVCHERYAILMSQGKTYARVLRLLLELAFTFGRDGNVANVEMLPITNVANYQLDIEHWHWRLLGCR